LIHGLSVPAFFYSGPADEPDDITYIPDEGGAVIFELMIIPI
jgi:hypothetical protein